MKRQPVYGRACLFIQIVSLFLFLRKQAFFYFLKGVKRLFFLFDARNKLRQTLSARKSHEKGKPIERLGRKATGLSPEASG